MAKNDENQKPTRLAIINPDICKPKECNLECKKACPVNRIGKECITVNKSSKTSKINEILCIGCSACAKKCPFNAITIVNLPTNLEKEVSHRYSANGFKLHRLPIPRLGQVLGLVGTNGIGKSTALKILGNKIDPNLGKLKHPPSWKEVLDKYKGSELQGYFTKILEKKIKTSYKIQYIDKLPKVLKKGQKSSALTEMDQKGEKNKYVEMLGLKEIMERDIEHISGGELQRFYIALMCMQDSNVYMFDEPSSYLDVKQRLAAARAIGSVKENNYVIVVEHDLAILDLMSDYGCVLYGVPGAYGVITKPFSIKMAINIFLDGFVPTENMKFRDEALKFNASEGVEMKGKNMHYTYKKMHKTFKNTFSLQIEEGAFRESEIILFLGENGMGKTTFINLVAGVTNPDDENSLPQLSVSLKPQKILPTFKGTVRELFTKKIKSSFLDPGFNNDVIKPLKIDYIIDSQVSSLSGGELQRVAIILCLGKNANIYLLDEPSAYLDCDQRIIVSKVIKRFIYSKKRTAFIVEHDLIMGTYLADKVVIFSGRAGVESTASSPMALEAGMNIFLKNLNITFRRDQNNYRPRINKFGSAKDREQKEAGRYFFT